MFLSVVIPTYNRLPILQKCLQALEDQELAAPITGYEVVLVDDGSTDDTVAWLHEHGPELPHLRLIQQEHGGPAEGRNRGVTQARGDVIVFIDSDLVVTPSFLRCHAQALERRWRQRGHRRCFTYGAVINTARFDDPTGEPHKLQDLSFAYFATGNVAIDRQLLEQAGLFDTRFRLYGWEDLEPLAITGIRPCSWSRFPIWFGWNGSGPKWVGFFISSTPPVGCGSSFSTPGCIGCSGSCSPLGACSTSAA
jgi:glycosyltransferase involved in cell wall biosynthesis